jgi:hypothetical protein
MCLFVLFVIVLFLFVCLFVSVLLMLFFRDIYIFCFNKINFVLFNDYISLIISASPNTPLISNIVQLNATHEVVYGNEGQSLTIQCTSTGGYPSPTVTWYKNSISSSNQLASTSSGTIQSDGTYTVNLQHTFTPTTSDDRKYLICRSYYPQADSAQVGSNNKSVLLYLRCEYQA